MRWVSHLQCCGGRERSRAGGAWYHVTFRNLVTSRRVKECEGDKRNVGGDDSETENPGYRGQTYPGWSSYTRKKSCELLPNHFEGSKAGRRLNSLREGISTWGYVTVVSRRHRYMWCALGITIYEVCCLPRPQNCARKCLCNLRTLKSPFPPLNAQMKGSFQIFLESIFMTGFRCILYQNFGIF